MHGTGRIGSRFILGIYYNDVWIKYWPWKEHDFFIWTNNDGLGNLGFILGDTNERNDVRRKKKWAYTY
jgi:hypothetical protein